MYTTNSKNHIIEPPYLTAAPRAVMATRKEWRHRSLLARDNELQELAKLHE
jgi:hypothetical protein